MIIEVEMLHIMWTTLGEGPWPMMSYIKTNEELKSPPEVDQFFREIPFKLGGTTPSNIVLNGNLDEPPKEARVIRSRTATLIVLPNGRWSGTLSTNAHGYNDMRKVIRSYMLGSANVKVPLVAVVDIDIIQSPLKIDMPHPKFTFFSINDVMAAFDHLELIEPYLKDRRVGVSIWTQKEGMLTKKFSGKPNNIIEAGRWLIQQVMEQRK